MKSLFRFIALAFFFLSASLVMDAKGKDEVVRILSIGNSFSVDALENHFYELATAAGKKVIVGNMYIGGCSLKRHLNNAEEDLPAYTYYKRGLDGRNVRTKEVTLATALADEQWDYVSFQQQSGRSGIYATWEKSLPALVEYVEARVPEDAVMMLHQTWAYDQIAKNKEFVRYDKDQMKMYNAIMDAVSRASDMSGVRMVIPSGTAVQNARTTSLVGLMCRDGYHLNKVYGRYVVACTWLYKVLGVNPIGNSYSPEGMTPQQKEFAQRAAYEAVKHPWKITKLVDPNVVNVKVSPDKVVGPVKIMNAANNGPIEGNTDAYAALRIPYARTHDTALCEQYGAKHCVDITCIFPDFDADVNAPESYDFTLTDILIERMIKAGTQPFFRLGQSIEHREKKYGIYPPADFLKWAQICEHIIRHYNEGWADGFHHGIEYWEIWNEPDLEYEDEKWKVNPRTWAGPPELFNEFYVVAAKHLRSCFPDIKIGGPAFADPLRYMDDFLDYVKKHDAPLDFFSWHRYDCYPLKFVDRVDRVRRKLDKKGFTDVPSILNEWNYVRSWSEPDKYSTIVKRNEKGAAYVAAVMCEAQNHPVDMLMYYDLRPNTPWNGAFESWTQFIQPTYYALLYWNAIKDCGTQVALSTDSPDMYACAASDGRKTAVLLSNYFELEYQERDRRVNVSVPDGVTSVQCRITDVEGMDKEMVLTPKKGCVTVKMKANSVALLQY